MDFIQTVKSINQEAYNSQMKKALLTAVRTADETTRETFFNSYHGPEYNTDIKAILSELSIKYTAYALSQINDSYGFSKISIAKDTLNAWFNINSNKAGPALFKIVLCDMGLEDCFNNKETWNKIVTSISDTSFITGLKTEEEVASKHTIFMLLGSIMAFDSVSADSISKKWYNIFQAAPLSQMPWFDSFTQFDIISPELIPDIRSAVNTVTKEYFTKNKGVYLPSGTVTTHPVNYERTIYGAAVQRWLNSDNGPKKYSISPPSSINNTSTYPPDPSSSGCILSSALILLENAAEKQASVIRPGDKLLTGSGSSVCSEDILKMRGTFILYGINGETPIFTSEHCIMTDRGWCSLEPELINEMNPKYEAKHLYVGDIVHRCRRSRNGKYVFFKEEIKSIETITVQEQEVYVFRTEFGAPECFANGVLTLLPFPDITPGYIRKRLSLMDINERRCILKIISDENKVFEKLLGKISFTALCNIMENDI